MRRQQPEDDVKDRVEVTVGWFAEFAGTRFENGEVFDKTNRVDQIINWLIADVIEEFVLAACSHM
jgi:hypothetical protein